MIFKMPIHIYVNNVDITVFAEKKNNCFLKQLGFMLHCLADYCSKAHTVLIQEKPKRIHGHQVVHITELRIHPGQTRKNIKIILWFHKWNPVSIANWVLYCCFLDMITLWVVFKNTTRFHFKNFCSRTLYNLALPQKLLAFQSTLLFLCSP